MNSVLYFLYFTPPDFPEEKLVKEALYIIFEKSTLTMKFVAHEENLYYPEEGHHSLIDNPIEIRPHSYAELKNIKVDKVIVVMDTPTKNNPNVIMGFHYYHNYSKMIADLEEEGKLITMPSKSILASDPRKFFVSGLMDEAMEVDCLGTSLHQSITKHIEDEWLCLKTQLKKE